MGTCATGDREAETETRATGGPPPRRPRRSAPHADGRVDVTPRTCGAEGGAEARRRERGRGDKRPAQRPRGSLPQTGGGGGGGRRGSGTAAGIVTPRGWPWGCVAADEQRGGGADARRRTRPWRSAPRADGQEETSARTSGGER